MTIEDQLRSALDAHDEPSFAIAPVQTVAHRVKQRTGRVRLLAATVSVVVIAAVGLGIGTVRSEAPSALLTTATESSDAESSVAELVVEGALDARRPDPRLVISDGEGGFIGADADQFWSALNGTRAQIRWSPDGVRWRNIGELATGDGTLMSLTRVDGEYIGFIASRFTAFQVDGVRVPDGLQDPGLQIARSVDLENWTITEVPIVYPEVDAAYDTFDVFHSPVSISAHDGRLLVQIGVWVEPDTAALGIATGDYCGRVDDDSGLSVLRCDGALFEVLDKATMTALGVDQPAVFFASDDGGSLVAVEPELDVSPVRILHTDAGFVTAVNGHVVQSSDGVVWDQVVDLPDDANWSAVAAGPGSEILLLGASGAKEADADDGAVPFAHIDVATGEVVTGLLPLDADVAPAVGEVASGPGGWAMVVTERRGPAWGTSDGGWTLSSFSGGGSPGRLPFYLVEESSVTADIVLENRASTVIERGLFGELRFMRPGADDVLIQVNRRELESVRYQERITAPEGFTGPYVHEGWTVSGDPLLGPLVVTDPEGVELVFSDGFAFTNGDVSDGVELLDGNPVSLDSGDLTIYDDGEAIWSAPFSDVLNYLTTEVAGSQIDSGGVQAAWVVHSVDGKEWRVVWEQEDAGFGDFPALAVGDDEAVVLPSRPPESAFIRIRIAD